MPASTNASYVGRFAPPGYPNTTSTPSALRHSMMASTARIRLLLRLEGEGRLTTDCGRFRLDRDLGEVEIVAAAHAHRVVQLDDLAAGRALAADLVAVGAVEDRGQQPEHGEHEADHEPDEERRAFDAADDAGAEAHPEREDEIDHRWRNAQTTANTTSPIRTMAKRIWNRPAIAAITILNARIATAITITQAMPFFSRLPMSLSVLAEFKGASIVHALQMRKALGARDLAVLEPQAGEAEAAHGRVGAAAGGHEHEPADRSVARGGKSSHGKHGRRNPAVCGWPGGRRSAGAAVQDVERGALDGREPALHAPARARER